jgi:hypothetical protein
MKTKKFFIIALISFSVLFLSLHFETWAESSTSPMIGQPKLLSKVFQEIMPSYPKDADKYYQVGFNDRHQSQHITLPDTSSWIGKDKVDFKTPIIYTSSLMFVGYWGLVAAGELDRPRSETFTKSFQSGPVSDADGWGYNFVCHPLWGSETYLRAREGNFGILGSIGFSMAASVSWEYFIESWSEHASVQDLIFTAGIGWLIGELRYQLKQMLPKKYHGFIDPIKTRLENFDIGVLTQNRDTQTMMVLFTWRF